MVERLKKQNIRKRKKLIRQNSRKNKFKTWAVNLSPIFYRLLGKKRMTFLIFFVKVEKNKKGLI